uniref:Ig-like domain-containing protein n=1 Tax=Cyclopterus lumpus TaxID=8103 RepID=A0A8C3A7Q3_CYCLU
SGSEHAHLQLFISPIASNGVNSFKMVNGYIHTGLTDGSDVTQTDLLWRNEGHKATMSCSHTKGSSYYQMYWYRQLPGEGMRQIVYTTPSPPHLYESGFGEDKFPATRSDAQTGSLTVEKLLPEDSGVYYCACLNVCNTTWTPKCQSG